MTIDHGRAAAAPLDDMRGTRRLLVVIAPDRADHRLAEQRRLFGLAGSGARERDLVWVEGVGRNPEADAIRRKFGVTTTAFQAILVGKDGRAKIRSASPLASDTLFGEIDAMPMRRDEMRRRAAWKGQR